MTTPQKKPSDAPIDVDAEVGVETGLLSELGWMLDDGLIVADKQGVILSVNAAAVRFLGDGVSGKSLIGQPLAEVIKADEVADVVSGAGLESSAIYRPQSRVSMEFNIRIKRMNDGLIMVLVLDMTLQRNLEKVRRDFVANVSHELRSPLTSLAGFIETILVNEVQDWPTQQRFLRIMEEESGRMSRLIDDLLSLSRVEVDEHIVPDETVPLMEVLKSVVASLESRAERRKMRILLNDARPVDVGRLLMNGFADEINEVFHNLIENALKYGFEESDISLDVALQGTDTVKIAVSNFGEPIAEKHLGRLTERFYRVDKARSRQIGGTGLGLAIVKHIVNRHRGVMNVSSSNAGITRFEVTLPVISNTQD